MTNAPALTARQRLLLVGLKWPPETFIMRMIEGLLAEGFEITVALSRQPARPLPEGIRWIWAPSWHRRRWQRWLFFPVLWLRGLLRRRSKGGIEVRQWRKRDNPDHWKHLYHLLPFWKRAFDVVYYPWLMSGHAYYYLLEQCTATTSLRGSHVNIAPLVPFRQKQVAYARKALQQTRRIHSVCRQLKTDAMRFFGIDASSVSVIYTGVDPAFFSPPPEKKEKEAPFTVIWVGNLGWVKAIEWALLAIHQIKRRGIPVRFIIAGDGPEKQRMHYTIMDLELEKEVQYVGKKSPAALVTLYRTADAFLLSSLSEGVANVAVEAMACGLPVVTTDAGGMREAVTDGVEGFVVPIRDVDAMADALEKLARDPRLRRQMGRAGRERVLQQFDLAHQQKLFAQFFRHASR